MDCKHEYHIGSIVREPIACSKCGLKIDDLIKQLEAENKGLKRELRMCTELGVKRIEENKKFRECLEQIVMYGKTCGGIDCVYICKQALKESGE